MSWQTAPSAPAALIAAERPEVVRITRSDSSRLVLWRPIIRQDTLYGSAELAAGDSAQGSRAIPLGDITAVETRRSDPTKTTLLGTGILVGTFTALCLFGDTFGCGDDAADILASVSR
jgi:hypothetical protein